MEFLQFSFTVFVLSVVVASAQFCPKPCTCDLEGMNCFNMTSNQLKKALYLFIQKLCISNYCYSAK